MSNGAARKRARLRKAKRMAEAKQELKQLDNHLLRKQRQQLRDPLWYLADEEYNRHVVHWEAGTLQANFEAEDESEGWISLNRADGRSMWFHPMSRYAFWTGFNPRTEFFIKDIEQYIHQKFYLP